MSTLLEVRGDATHPHGDGNKIIAHICNDIGAWGRGFVLAISARWPGPAAQYRTWSRSGHPAPFALGEIQLVKVEPDTWVANMVAQRGVRRNGARPPIRYDALRQCLEELSLVARGLDATVHMPRIGTGLAGGDWEVIEPIVRTELVGRRVPVTVYRPR